MDDRRAVSRPTPPYAETPLYTRSSAFSFAATQDREQDSTNTSEFDMEQNGRPLSPTLRRDSVQDEDDVLNPALRDDSSSPPLQRWADYHTARPSSSTPDLSRPQLSSFQDLIALLPSQQHRDSEMFTLARKSQAFPTMQNRQSFLNRRRSTAIGTIVRAISSTESNEAHGEMEDAIAAAKMLKGQPVRLQNRLGSVREEMENAKNARQRLGLFQLWFALTSQAIISKYGSIQAQFKDLKLFENSIKHLAGTHGAAVGTFFNFMRYIMLFNLCLAALWALFIVVPYSAIFHFGNTNAIVPAFDTSFSTSQTLVGLFTGGADLNYSAYFIGSYIVPTTTVAGSAPVAKPSTYSIPMAYLLLCGFYLLFSLILIFRQVYWAVYSRTVVLDDGAQPYSEMILCGFDHSLMSKQSVELKRMGLTQLIKESLEEEKANEKQAHIGAKVYAKRVLINVAILAILSASLYVVQLTVSVFTSQSNSLSNLIPPFILAVMNFVLPIVFESLASFEDWRTELFVIQLTVVRATIVRIAGLFVFLYTVFLKSTSYMCWESYVGQYLYNLFLSVTAVECLTSAFTDFAKHLFYNKKYWISKYVPIPRFDTIDGTISLIYAQGIVMFGTFYCPLLPLLGALRCIFLFKIKKWSTLKFCEPPVKAFKARFSFSELFYAMMLLMLFLVAFPLGYSITRLPTSGAYMSDAYQDTWVTQLPSSGNCSVANVSCAGCLASYNPASTVCWKPTGSANYPNGALLNMSALCLRCPSGCGPFRNQESMYDTAINEFHKWDSTSQSALSYIGTTAFAGLVLTSVLIAVFYVHAKASARAALVERIRRERDEERLDKIWILQKYAIILDDRK